MLGDEYRPSRSRIVHTVTRPQFRANRGPLLSFASRALEHRSDPEQLLYLQAEMANNVMHLQRALKNFRQEADGGADAQDGVDVCKGLIYATKQIADGIAWRSLDYNRGVIHELAFAPQTGHLELDTVVREISRAAEHVSAYGGIVLLNDLTNYLRFGDLTIVTPKTIWIDEVKAGEASARSGRAKRQRKRIRQVIEFISRRERSTDRGRHRLVRSASRPRSHTRDLESLICQANSTGSAHARLSDALAVDVFNLELAAERGEAQDKDFHNPFRHSPRARTFTNLEHFGIFTPNIAPYAVFPLPPDQRVDLMTGRLLLLAYVNADNVIRGLRRRGLTARFPDDRQLKALPKNLKPGEVRDHELDAPIVVANDRNAGHLSLGVLGLVGYELLDEEAFADSIKEHLEEPRSEEEMAYMAFENERELWD